MGKQMYKRNRTRFPAYDDDIGVKIKSDRQRVLFDGDDDFLTDYKLDASEVLKREVKRSTRTHRRVVLESDRSQRELKQHRANLPDYAPRHHRAERKLPERRASKGMFEETAIAAKAVSDQQQKKTFTKKSGRSATPYVPTHVPSSIVPDKPEAMISPTELMASMNKKNDSYLLFESGEKKFQSTNEGTGRLDRSLRGMIKENDRELENSKYFRQ